jgi:hypothetical protein
MDREGLKYRRQDNCFSWIDDLARAQSLLDQQLTTDWASALNGCVARIHPLFPELCEKYPMNYYWTSFQSEWARDIVFRDPRRLEHLYPQLIHLGMVSFSSPDVMRFMDKKVTRKGDAVSHSTPLAIGLVVKLNRVLSQPVFDAHPLTTDLHITDHLV